MILVCNIYTIKRIVNNFKTKVIRLLLYLHVEQMFGNSICKDQILIEICISYIVNLPCIKSDLHVDTLSCDIACLFYYHSGTPVSFLRGKHSSIVFPLDCNSNDNTSYCVLLLCNVQEKVKDVLKSVNRVVKKKINANYLVIFQKYYQWKISFY